MPVASIPALIAAITGIVSAATAAGSGVASGVAAKRQKDAADKLKKEQAEVAKEQDRRDKLAKMDQKRAALARTLGVNTPYRMPQDAIEEPTADIGGVYSAQKASDVLGGISTAAGMASSGADDLSTVGGAAQDARSAAIKRRNAKNINPQWVQDDTAGGGA